MNDIDVTDLLPRLAVPTLVLHCRDDAVVPFDEGRRLAGGILGARFVPLQGGNHLMLEGEPASAHFLDEVRAFLGTAAGPSPTKRYAVAAAATRGQTLPAMASHAPLGSDAPDRPSIAVLPFTNLDGDPQHEYFVDGVVEDIITGLARARWLFVIARNSSFVYKRRACDVRQVGRELGVRYVLDGSIRKAGERVRIAVQLLDGTSGNQVWAQRYDRELSDIFDLQDEITETILGAVEPELGKLERKRAATKRPDSVDAWDLYQRGMSHLYQYTKEDLALARQFFWQATEKDPRLGPAYSGLAEAYY
jgi:TolB-like protein